MPTANAGLLIRLGKWHGGACEKNSPVLNKINLMLNPSSPITDELRLIQKNIFLASALRLTLAPRFKDGFYAA